MQLASRGARSLEDESQEAGPSRRANAKGGGVWPGCGIWEPRVSLLGAASVVPHHTTWLHDPLSSLPDGPRAALRSGSWRVGPTWRRLLRMPLEARNGDVWSEVSLLKQDHRNVVSHVIDVEDRVSEFEDTMHSFGNDLVEVKAITKIWKVGDAENCARCNNLRLVVEGTNMVDFLGQWLRANFTADNFSTCFVSKQTHRVVFSRPPPSDPPIVL
ncbi:hypothetical protein NDU88_006985 [Pleurodeles waltl]|uniref:Uncharacterized protein n=1 Tax=Pleurodeles waltl TaxID=8319 RepID=A0AAV7NAA3_PLEWA|nr:hypothetical protein NDU88_006985 [Pleurodeles waltl]